MGKDQLPILPCNVPWIPVNGNLIRPTTFRILSENGPQNITRTVKVEDILRWNSFFTLCNGKYCSKLDLCKDGKVREEKCTCVAATQQKGVPMLAMDIKMTTNMHEDIIVRDFTNQAFIENFVFKHKISAGTKLPHFDNPYFADVMDNTLDTIFTEVYKWHVENRDISKMQR